MASGGTVFQDFGPYAPSGNEPASFIGAPIHDHSGQTVGVVALQIPLDQINEIMQEYAGMGDTGETYLVGQDLLMRSDSRFSEESTVFKQKVDTDATRAAFTGATGEQVIADYRDVEVLSAYAPLNIQDVDWVIVAEINTDEAFASVQRLVQQMLLIALGAVIVVVWPAVYTTRSVTRSFEELQAGASILASSSTQIMTATAQVAVGATETATSVSETSTTVEEVRQAADVVNQKARRVADSAQRAVEVSQTGEVAVNETIEVMAHIRTQMESVGDSIIRLSEQSQTIGEIIATVNDLADQSNLLAVNASIEAAKAGEHGKGFVVVAEEIKSMAEQSKQATRNVRAILSDIQKAVSTAVLATEQGNKAVEAGVRQSTDAGEAIRALTQSIKESAQAAILIATSARQQLTGMDQMTVAMENIDQASAETAASTRQAESAAQDLNELGQRLQDLLEQY